MLFSSLFGEQSTICPMVNQCGLSGRGAVNCRDNDFGSPVCLFCELYGVTCGFCFMFWHFHALIEQEKKLAFNEYTSFPQFLRHKPRKKRQQDLTKE